MSRQFVTTAVSHQVALVTLQHPPANVLNHAVLDELEQRLGELEADEGVRVLVLTGAGRFFSAGADIHELAQINAPHSGSAFSRRGQALLNRIEQLDKPVIAAINGTCVGGGLELAMACHIRLAAEGSVLGLPEIKLGVIPGFGGTQRLPRIVGPSKATELILAGENITAEEALRIGLVNRVVPLPELVAHTQTLASMIVERGSVAIQSALRAIRAGLENPLSMGLAREAELFGELCATADKREGTQAFLEKRTPRVARFGR